MTWNEKGRYPLIGNRGVICSLLRWLLTLALMAYALMGGYYWMQHDCIGGREFNVDGHWYKCQLSSPETVCEAPR